MMMKFVRAAAPLNVNDRDGFLKDVAAELRAGRPLRRLLPLRCYRH
jgi:hypothetical protein